MPNANTIVDLVQRLDPPLTHPQRTKPSAIAVHLRGGGIAHLDMKQAKAAVFADLLDEVRLSNQPVYLEVDPVTGQIQQVLFPTILVPSVVPATAGGDRHDVEFIPSQARHFLRPTNPNYRQMLAALSQAQQSRVPVLVTETSREHEIIDVRPVPAGVSRPPWIAAVSAGPGGAAGTPGPAAPLTITPARAQDAFDLVNAQTCSAMMPSAGCIPFLYPDDGCWARAHEMCRLMLGDGFYPSKVWIYHTGPLLSVDTPNHPDCKVEWTYHVAPTLLVDAGAGSEVWVVDPSMFTTGPVPQAGWVAAQHNTGAVVLSSGPDVYFRDRSGATVTSDPSYTFQNADLPTYRRALRVRSLTDGPPPYAHC